MLADCYSTAIDHKKSTTQCSASLKNIQCAIYTDLNEEKFKVSILVWAPMDVLARYLSISIKSEGTSTALCISYSSHTYYFTISYCVPPRLIPGWIGRSLSVALSVTFALFRRETSKPICAVFIRVCWLERKKKLNSSEGIELSTGTKDDGGVVVQRGLWFRFTCNFCHKNFNHKNNFRKHLRTHTGEKPYMCPQCSYCSARSDLLRAHLHKKHPYFTSSSQV
ncbi:testis-specific zinc finger protein topi-like [Penaeus japonicus]|uniref:testis-specific zinc finger protein topi-like n=1 Tax=Penaeus japonicus TaxID=27405 RepID=UPI001C70C7CA|nr:testis-specific zinc finger protein topi-like [Penaeus japonicus]